MFFIIKKMSFKDLVFLKLLFFLPLAVWFLTGYFIFNFSIIDLTDFLPLKIYVIIFLIFLIIFCILSISRKRWGLFLIGIGLFFAVINLVINIFFYFRGLVYLGEGEDFKKRYVDVIKGAFSKPPSLPLVVIGVQKDRVLLLLDIKEYELKKGDSIRYGFNRISLNEIGRAPLLTLYDKRGLELESAFYIVTGASSDYFQFSTLPHQFYLEPSAEERIYNLRIMRGKLTIFRGIIPVEGSVDFEEFRIDIKEGSRWVLLEIEREYNYYLLPFLLLIIPGIFIETIGKRDAEIDKRNS